MDGDALKTALDINHFMFRPAEREQHNGREVRNKAPDFQRLTGTCRNQR
ncbi:MULTISPECIES: hypothetical protein [unclassified Mesorhizobium]|nr:MULTISPECIES: hypothetical protein [unclassified Mesorhizobium]